MTDIASCDLCRKHAITPRFTALITGNARVDVLFIKMAPTPEEIAARALFDTDAGHAFARMVRKGTGRGLDQYGITTVLHCPMEKIHIAHVRNCNVFLREVLAKRKWKIVVCLGPKVLSQVYLRGGSAPDMNMLLDHPVNVRETDASVVTVPDPDLLLTPTASPEDRWYDPLKDMLNAERAMLRGMETLRKCMIERGIK